MSAEKPDLKVTDRRWWVKGENEAPVAEEPRLKPTYIEELEDGSRRRTPSSSRL